MNAILSQNVDNNKISILRGPSRHLVGLWFFALKHQKVHVKFHAGPNCFLIAVHIIKQSI